jgi:GNAT superfamily N-acetyltransferase
MVPVTYRNLTHADVPAGLQLCRIAGWNQLAADWELLLNLGPGRAAVRDDKVVGTVTTVKYEKRFAWIGMVLVHPSVRSQGIGSQLLKEALNVLDDVPSARLDATPQGRPVYQRLGFLDEYELCRMQITSASSWESEISGASGDKGWDTQEGSLQCRPILSSDMPAVVDADRQYFGADRERILRWAWQQAPEYAWSVDSSSGTEGYCFGRRGFNFDQIGPVQARTEAIARRLVRACLSAKKTGRAIVIDPMHHSVSWLAWLQQIGFVHQRPFMRMYLGENRYPGNPSRLWSIFGPEFG